MDLLPDITLFQRRLDELDAQMAAPSFYANPRKATEVSREQQSLRRLVETHTDYERVGRELAEHGDGSHLDPLASFLKLRLVIQVRVR